MEIVPVTGCPTRGRVGASLLTRTIRHGPKGKDLNLKSLELPHAQPYNCPPRNCAKCKGKRTQNVTCQYIQPPRAKSFAPKKVYCTPLDPMESNTIYRGSYMPAEGDRPDPVYPRHNVRIPCTKFAGSTVQKMSFPGWYNAEKVEPIIPCSHKLIGDGPISDDTTNRLDYIEKNIDPATPILPRHNLFMHDAPFANSTINKLSYQPNECVKKRDPFIQTGTMVWPSGPLEQKTIQKMSFQPCKIPKKEFYPWAQKPQYHLPTTKMPSETVYRKSYIPNEEIVKATPIVPVAIKNLLAESDGFDGNTIYHMSYPVNEGLHRPDEIRPRHNIHLATAKMQSQTTQKMSYIPNLNVAPPDAIIPCNHQLIGKGPMEDTSTTMADYFEKGIDKVDPFLPRPNLFLSDSPFANQTINRLSFMPPDPKEQTGLIIPNNQYVPPTGPLSNQTTQKMSYMPTGPIEPVEKPWATKKPYCPPAHKFCEDTCYRMSYDVPGEWVNCELDDGPCECECQPDCTCPCPPVPVC